MTDTHPDTPTGDATAPLATHPGTPTSARSTPETKRPPRSARPARSGPGKPARKPVHPLLEQLHSLYPALFGARFLPLKRGIFQDLQAAHPDLLERDALKQALRLHTRSSRYLEAVAAGQPRHNLQGEVVEPMAAEHVHQAIVELYQRRQARSAEDLRPQFVPRLVAAILASGLERDAYTALVGNGNESASTLLDAALTEVGAQHARQDALLRAYEAAGSTSLAEFAAMYGLSEAAATLTLVQARRRRPNPSDIQSK